jgi:SH3-like domain-containing protein
MKHRCPGRWAAAALAGLVLLATLAPALDAGADNVGLPVPRFVSLRAGEVNMRTGPGEQYPVEWVYRRQGLPIEIIGEYHTWRRVRDWQGTEGWIHVSMLSGRRAVIITGGKRTLHQLADSQSPVAAEVEPGVIGRLLECRPQSAWCRIDIDGTKGWIKRSEFWGVYEDEAVD